MSKNDSQIVISKKTLIIVLIVFLLLLVGAVTVAMGWDAWFGDALPTGPSSSQNGKLDIDENAGDWNGQTLPDKTEDKPAEKKPAAKKTTAKKAETKKAETKAEKETKSDKK